MRVRFTIVHPGAVERTCSVDTYAKTVENAAPHTFTSARLANVDERFAVQLTDIAPTVALVVMVANMIRDRVGGVGGTFIVLLALFLRNACSAIAVPSATL